VSHLGEEAEAFFQKGDEGTYDGGPSSLQPSARDAAPEHEEALTTELSTEQLERRDRFKRLVTTIVGSLGVAVLILVPLRLGASNASSEPQAAGFSAPAPTAEATAARELETPTVPARTAAPALPAVHATPVASPAVHAAPIAHKSHTPVTRKAVSRATPSPARPASQSSALRGRHPGAQHVPPTANFPD